MNQKITVSVIGARKAPSAQEKVAYEVGKIIASQGAVTVCGGLLGLMQAAAKGAKERGGLTIGLLPGIDKKAANRYIDIALPTSIGFARNVMVACSADIIVALPGSYGTTSEICYGLVYGRPVLDLGNWKIKGMIPVKNLKDLEKKLTSLIKKVQRERHATSVSRAKKKLD